MTILEAALVGGPLSTVDLKVLARGLVNAQQRVAELEACQKRLIGEAVEDATRMGQLQMYIDEMERTLRQATIRAVHVDTCQDCED